MIEPLQPGLISSDDISSLYPGHIQVTVLRLDKIHPVISGNKWFKLRFYIEQAIAQGKKQLLTFGGAWSNHIVAAAAACQMNGLSCTGIIRGEEPRHWSPTLLKAKELGMQLVFTDRESYREKKIPATLNVTDYYIISEGGYGLKGAKGAAGILNYANQDFTHCCCAVGTGTMMAGLINVSGNQQQVIGISVLKNDPELEPAVKFLLDHSANNWQVLHDYHFGGYGKHKFRLLSFMNDLYTRTGIPTDFVYTAKLFYGVDDLIRKDFFPAGSRVLLIHSGGLQGNASLPKGTLIF